LKRRGIFELEKSGTFAPYIYNATLIIPVSSGARQILKKPSFFAIFPPFIWIFPKKNVILPQIFPKKSVKTK